MTPRPRTGSEEKIRVVILHEKGYIINKIVERLHVARRTTHDLIKSTERLEK